MNVLCIYFMLCALRELPKYGVLSRLEYGLFSFHLCYSPGLLIPRGVHV
jgi:hypothetical protein